MNQPETVDWANFNPPSKFIAPPPAQDDKGMPIVYTATLPKEFKAEEDEDGMLQFVVDPIVLKGGYEIRFSRAGVKLFERNGKKQNANRIGTLLRSAGVRAMPQTNDDYIAAVKSVAGRSATITIDWRARNKDTGEVVQGYQAFPLDPERPGQRKAILKRGDTYNVIDRKGAILETKVVESEVLFANAQVRYYVDPTQPRRS